MLVLTDKVNGSKILTDLQGAVVEVASDGSTKVIFGGGSMVREVKESIDEIEAAVGGIVPKVLVAAMAAKLAKKKR